MTHQLLISSGREPRRRGGSIRLLLDRSARGEYRSNGVLWTSYVAASFVLPVLCAGSARLPVHRLTVRPGVCVEGQRTKLTDPGQRTDEEPRTKAQDFLTDTTTTDRRHSPSYGISARLPMSVATAHPVLGATPPAVFTRWMCQRRSTGRPTAARTDGRPPRAAARNGAWRHVVRFRVDLGREAPTRCSNPSSAATPRAACRSGRDWGSGSACGQLFAAVAEQRPAGRRASTRCRWSTADK